MQQLQFETSWDKALSVKDRQLIENIFNKTKQAHGSAIFCSPIREAINHKQELLVTVIIHNSHKIPSRLTIPELSIQTSRKY